MIKTEEITVKAVEKGGLVDTGKIIISDWGNDVELDLQFKEHHITDKGEFPFVVLQNIRRILEERQIVLLINGSRYDIYPSGMQWGTFNAYELEIGKQATKTVDILDPTELIGKIGTVDQQDKYFEKWCDSL